MTTKPKTPTLTTTKAKVNWLALEPKIKAVAAAALILDGATVLAAWNGTVGWHDAIGAILAIDIPAIAGYLKSSKP